MGNASVTKNSITLSFLLIFEGKYLKAFSFCFVSESLSQLKSRGQLESFQVNESFESEILNRQLRSQRASPQTPSTNNLSMADCRRTNSSRRGAVSVLRSSVIKKR